MKKLFAKLLKKIKTFFFQLKSSNKPITKYENKKIYFHIGISTLISILFLQIYLKNFSNANEVEEIPNWKKIDIYIKGNIHFKNGDKIFIYNQNQKLIITKAIFIKQDLPQNKMERWDDHPGQGTLKNLVTIATPEENFQYWEELANSQNNPLILLPQNTYLKQKPNPLAKRRNIQYEFNY